MIRRLIAPAMLLGLLFTAVCAAQENHFHLIVGGGAASGTEQYTVTSTADGHAIKGKVTIQQGSTPITYEYDEELTADWNIKSYEVSINAGGQRNTASVRREGDQLLMSAGAAGGKAVAAGERSIVLDNTVIGLFQALLEKLRAEPNADENAAWSILVPQRLAALTAAIHAGGEETGQYLGKPITLRRYSLPLTRGVTEDVWADAATHQLMRVSVPMQNAEFVREGFLPKTLDATAASAPADYVERNFSFQSAGLTLPGTLCLPKAEGPKFPLVVLVQGSGPHDRDETIGPNKPFADLAHGLAARGIATLRYDKRTLFDRNVTPAGITLNWEVNDDALAALGAARTLPEIDAQRIFVLGHSLGAMLAPYIAERAPQHNAGHELRGVILMAAAARPHYQWVDDQIRSLMKANGASEQKIEENLAQQHELIGKVERGELPDDQMIQGAPVHYFRELIALDPAGELRKLSVPALVLQGGKDVQVFRPDYELLVNAQHERARSGDAARFFPELNHLFMPVEGESSLQSYNQPGHVATEVVRTIADWVKARSE